MTVKNVAKAKEEPNMDVLYHFSSAGWFHMGYNSVVSLLQDGHMTIGQLGFKIQEKCIFVRLNFFLTPMQSIDIDRPWQSNLAAGTPMKSIRPALRTGKRNLVELDTSQSKQRDSHRRLILLDFPKSLNHPTLRKQMSTKIYVFTQILKVAGGAEL